MSSRADLLTHSRLSCFRACPRRHYIRYELGITPETDSFPLRVGSAFHAALEAADKGGDPEAVLQDRLDNPHDLALVAAMFHGHREQWESDHLEPVATELTFDLPILNPETGAPTPIWRVAGVIDRIVRLPDGRTALMEYKTTSRDFSPGADYWLALHLDQQLSIYVIAARALGYPIDTVLYDVTRRPGLRPLTATPEAARKYTKEGRLYANQRDTDETPEEFAARVAADIVERPDHYFARIEIARLEQDLEDCRRELWIQQLSIRAAQRADHWYRNPGACFGTIPCSYLSICGNRDLVEHTPTGFKRLDDVHPELAGMTSGG